MRGRSAATWSPATPNGVVAAGEELGRNRPKTWSAPTRSGRSAAQRPRPGRSSRRRRHPVGPEGDRSDRRRHRRRAARTTSSPSTAVRASSSENGALFRRSARTRSISNEGLGIESRPALGAAEITSVAEIVNGTTTVTGTVDGAPEHASTNSSSSQRRMRSRPGSARASTSSPASATKSKQTTRARPTSRRPCWLWSCPSRPLLHPDRHRRPEDRDLGVLELRLGGISHRRRKQIPRHLLRLRRLPLPTPVNGKSVTVAPKSGRVLIKVPGSNKFVPLGDLQSIPVGSIVDATNGRVTLTSVDANGVEQSADFYEGRFQISQAAGGALVTLRLRGGDFSSCPKAGSSARASKRSGRRLWGSGSGRFRTQGNFGSASVRGTIWLTVRPVQRHPLQGPQGGGDGQPTSSLDKTVSLPAGKSYLARRP